MRAPFPWFGGKSRAAGLVWARFGDVPNYVEPFAGSLAVLLARRAPPRLETVNDADCYVANFWRALQADPEALAAHATWPVNEADLHARHTWLVGREEFRERMKVEPEHFDAKVAGWWVWGLCSWIGTGWCDIGRQAGRQAGRWKEDAAPVADALACGPWGSPSRTLPKISHSDPGGRLDGLRAMFGELADRLRLVRVCCGDWSRVVTPAVTVGNGLTGVLLDPPYASERDEVYGACDSRDVAHAVRRWAVANGDDPSLRIALCGYEGEHAMPVGWDCVAWKANGGYANQGKREGVDENARKERIWFSRHCLKPGRGLFDGAGVLEI